MRRRKDRLYAMKALHRALPHVRRAAMVGDPSKGRMERHWKAMGRIVESVNARHRQLFKALAELGD